MSLEKHYSSFRSNGDPIDDINKTKMYNICVKSYNSPIEDHFNSLVDDGGGGFSIFVLMMRMSVTTIFLLIIEIRVGKQFSFC